jgi:hypothetical protein
LCARLGVVILLLVSFPAVARAQVGHIFVSVEAYVGLARVVHVGKIVELKRIEYDKPLTETQKIGKPYRLVFEVSETIRGEGVDRLELVVSLQSFHDLQFLREQAVEIMLVAGPNRLDRYPIFGIEEQGKRVDGERYQFRLLDRLKVAKANDPESDKSVKIASQLNQSYDSCRMFTSELEIVEGRMAILQRARDFAKEHTKLLSGVSLIVPNEFGALVDGPKGYAYWGIMLPICPATKTTLTALKDDPGRILRRIKPEDETYARSRLLEETDKALAKFADGDGE